MFCQKCPICQRTQTDNGFNARCRALDGQKIGPWETAECILTWEDVSRLKKRNSQEIKANEREHQELNQQRKRLQKIEILKTT